MQLLRKLADKGHTIVLVTHATNNIYYCDSVCFMARGGRLAFYGAPAEALAYFGTKDFAEIYRERPIYRRERMVNLGIAPYIFPKSSSTEGCKSVAHQRVIKPLRTPRLTASVRLVAPSLA